MGKNNYVDNKKFYKEMIEYKELVAESEGQPPVPEYIAKCFLEIANGLSYRPNFINYTYKEEMILDGVENCLRYCLNFNGEKSKNPFSYFTQIIYYAFLRRIEKEKKQSYIKNKLTSHYEHIVDPSIKVYYDDDLIDDFERKIEERKQLRTISNSLEKFIE